MMKDVDFGEKYRRVVFGQTDANLGWAAGFLEGDGCFHVYNQKNRGGSTSKRPLIILTNSDKGLLEHFQNILFGYGTIRRKWEKGRTTSSGVTGNRDVYQLRIASKQARLVAQLLFPYLVGEKKQKLLENPNVWRVSPNHTQGTLPTSNKQGSSLEVSQR